LRASLSELGQAFVLGAAREIDLFKKQMMFEKRTAQSLRAMGAKTKNTVPKLLFKGIELDTTKHAHMYATLIDLASGATISKVEHYEMRKELERHVANEKIMLLQAQRIARTMTDARMKPLLKVILADEKRHHKTLSTLLRTIAVEEKISEDDWWDYLNKWAVFST
jgi:rubrerythrin